MILVTGGTGFIGQVLVRHLVEAGYAVRLLIRPASHSPDLPRGIPVEVAVSSLTDVRGLRSAMVDVNVVYHLAGGEWQGARADLLKIDIQGTQAVSQVAADARVERFFYVSHLGAERGSAYPVLKAKAIAEEFIRQSHVPFTILRSAIVFGQGDSFTTGLARLLATFPIMLIPDNGEVLLQPIWVEDLVTCLVWALENENTRNQVISLGGPEYLSFNHIAKLIMEAIPVRRRIWHTFPPYLRGLTVILEAFFPGLPTSVYWLDYLATNRTCPLDTTLRMFNLLPGRFSQHLEYLGEKNWRKSWLSALFRRK